MMEQLYNDFTTKLLPTIQQGLVITKDYFMDLFARYIKYLIISDSIKLIMYSILAIFAIYALNRSLKLEKPDGYYEMLPSNQWKIIFSSLAVIVCLFCVKTKTEDLIKDIYIPEVRIYQQVQSMRSEK